MNPVFFQNQNEFRKWLEKNHNKKSEVIVGYYKSGTGKPSMTWSQSVDQAICFGWIDGIRRSIDEEKYCIRFPRKLTSIWSNVNIKKVEELKKKGLMKEPGLEVYNNRKESKSGIYSFENQITKLHDNFEEIFKANINAWDFFTKQAPSYKKTKIHWIMSARQETTKITRLNKLISASEIHTRLF
jgi:uncharacterized protein YdeI (YjbR/CyaY-like superfamily)